MHTHTHARAHTHTRTRAHTHTHTFNGPLSVTTRVSRYQKGKTNLDFTEVSGSGISWATCKSAPRSRQITTPGPHHSSFLQAGCPSCRPTNSVKALKVPENNSNYSILRKKYKPYILLQTMKHTIQTVKTHLFGRPRIVHVFYICKTPHDRNC